MSRSEVNIYLMEEPDDIKEVVDETILYLLEYDNCDDKKIISVCHKQSLISLAEEHAKKETEEGYPSRIISLNSNIDKIGRIEVVVEIEQKTPMFGTTVIEGRVGTYRYTSRKFTLDKLMD